MNIQQIKDTYPLRETVERFAGANLAKRSDGYDLYYCPFHNDIYHASFVVKDGYCRCLTECKINGKEWGDVVDFLMEILKVKRVYQLAEKLNMQLPTPPPKVLISKEKEPDKPLEWWHVQKGVKHQVEALPFFASRGLREDTVKLHHLGLYPSHPGEKFEIDGAVFQFTCKRYTIPDVAFGKVRKIELRLDPESADETIQLMNPSVRDKICAQFEQKTGRSADATHLRDIIFGGKYTRVWGGIRRELIGNVERVMRRIEHDGQTGWFSPDLPYVIFNEGAIKALALEDAAADAQYGYPAIYGHAPEGLGSLHGVREIIIVQDNDPDKQKKDGTWFNPGYEYALKALEMTRRRLGQGVRIISPPEGFNGADDVVKAGLAHEWLNSHGLEPIKLR